MALQSSSNQTSSESINSAPPELSISIMVPNMEANVGSIVTNGICRSTGFFMSNAVTYLNSDCILIIYNPPAVC